MSTVNCYRHDFLGCDMFRQLLISSLCSQEDGE